MEREAWEPEMETEDTDSSKRFEWAPAVGVGVERVNEGLTGAELGSGTVSNYPLLVNSDLIPSRQSHQ